MNELRESFGRRAADTPVWDCPEAISSDAAFRVYANFSRSASYSSSEISGLSSMVVEVFMTTNRRRAEFSSCFSIDGLGTKDILP
jgi:hypothetical protein